MLGIVPNQIKYRIATMLIWKNHITHSLKVSLNITQNYYLQFRQFKMTEMFPRQTCQFISCKIAERNKKLNVNLKFYTLGIYLNIFCFKIQFCFITIHAILRDQQYIFHLKWWIDFGIYYNSYGRGDLNSYCLLLALLHKILFFLKNFCIKYYIPIDYWTMEYFKT